MALEEKKRRQCNYLLWPAWRANSVLTYKTGTSTLCLHTKFGCLVILFSLKCLPKVVDKVPHTRELLLSAVTWEPHFCTKQNKTKSGANPPAKGRAGAGSAGSCSTRSALSDDTICKQVNQHMPVLPGFQNHCQDQSTAVPPHAGWEKQQRLVIKLL